ncbi:MAG: ABC transporter permease [Propionibacteriales bacterium]|nr:ABC transporter permease [Propionibacteriales bacterium]
MSLQPERPDGVIHDIGYRPYGGRRLGEGAVAWSLFVVGTRHAYGLGRSARSKVLPFLLLGAMLLPAAIIVGVVVQADLETQPLDYSTYQLTTLLLISVFVASQAPTLFSRDVRYRTLTLYFARPIRRVTFVLIRFASLATAVFILIFLPLLLLYVGGLLADMPIGRETGDFLRGVVGAVVLALVLAAFSAVIAATTVRRGLAIAAIIVALVLSYTVVSSFQGIAAGTGNPGIAQVAGAFSPYTLVNGFQAWAFDVPWAGPPMPIGAGVGVGYLAVACAVVLGSIGLLMWRYRRLAAV